jgi:transcriptional regulator with XRE-family HTH domain
MRFHYGQIIRMYRQQRGMSQSELAARWPKADGTEGVNTRYVQDIEYGKKQIGDPATLRKLAALLAIPLWSLGLSEYDPFQPTTLPDLPMPVEEAGATAYAQSGPGLNEYSPHIPSAYYERMLRAYTQVEPLLFSWTMWNLGLNQLHTQISHARQSASSIAVFKCAPPHPFVRSLYEIARHDLPLPQMMKLRFYGRESLAGQTILAGKTLVDGSRCAVPIMRRNCAGACLLVQAPSALDARQIEIIQHYANLFSLAFSDSEFYAPEHLDLCTIPVETRQDILLQEFDLQRLDLASLNVTDPERIRRAEELVLRSILSEKRGDVDVLA